VVEHSHHQVVQALLGAIGDDDLVRGKLQLIVAQEFARDSRFQVRRAVYLGVAGFALADGLDRCLADVCRGVEIRLASAK
jgi:hypothetical protein